MSKDIQTTDLTSFPYIFEKNVSVPLKNGGVIRCNVYRPRDSIEGVKYPVLATYGPYGKDVPYSIFNPGSYAEVNPEHKTDHSAWETPTPSWWVRNGYIVVRGDEIGTGQSPGYLNALSKATIDSFYDLIEWASEQSWSTGKVGLLGISYFGATQWQVAARTPKGLAAIVPWEGFSDFYRDACRHGGILSNGGFDAIWNRQIGPNQYGLPGRAARSWGDDTIEGSMPDGCLANNRTTLVEEARSNPFRDNPRMASMDCELENIEVPLLSVANWGGILLHLRGNVQGYVRAGSEIKYLRFIVGRHDLPFYYKEEVKIQKSFLDAFLKGDDPYGWSRKEAPPVDIILRRGDVGYNSPEAEVDFKRRRENEWPIARTKYTELFLQPDGSLDWEKPSTSSSVKVGWEALGATPGSDAPASTTLGWPSFEADNLSSNMKTFIMAPFESETEITGHIVLSLNVSVSADDSGAVPSDMDLFVSLRHISSSGKEISYTGTTGEAAPITKGFLRVSLRKVNSNHPLHRPWLPHRDYLSSDVLPVLPDKVYNVDIELWPTNVIVEKGARLALDIGSSDQPGTGIFTHNDPTDRAEAKFKGRNFIHFGSGYCNLITLPIIP